MQDPAGEVLDLYKTNKQQVDELLNQKRKDMDLKFLNSIIQRIGDPDISYQDQTILCLIAKNFFHTTQTEYKISVFQKYHQLDKTSRMQNLQNVKNQLNNIDHAYMLLAYLLEEEVVQSSNLSMHRTYIQDLIDSQTLKAVQTLHYLFMMSSFQTINEIIQKQRNFLDKLLNIIQQGSDIQVVLFSTEILAKIVVNQQAFSSQITEFTIQLANQILAVEKSDQHIRILCSCIGVLIEVCKYRQNDVFERISQIQQIINQICELYAQDQASYEVAVINVLIFFKQLDICDYTNNLYVVQSYLQKFYYLNQLSVNVQEELDELINQLLKHYYIQFKDQLLRSDPPSQQISDQDRAEYTDIINNMNYNQSSAEITQRIIAFDQKMDNLLQVFTQLLDIPPDQLLQYNNLRFITQLQPLYRHSNLLARLNEINNMILGYFDSITQNDFQKYQTAEIHWFIRFLNNYIIYTPQDEFINKFPGINSVINVMLHYIDRIDSRIYFQLVNNFLNKLYVCEYNDFSNVLQSLLQQIYFQIIYILKANDRIIYEIQQHFNQYFNINEFLFKQKVQVYLDQQNQANKFSKEFISFKIGDIQIQQYYNIVANQTSKSLPYHYFAVQSLLSLKHISTLVFDLMEKIMNNDQQHVLILQNNSLTLLGNCILSLNECCCCDSTMFNAENSQICSLDEVVERILPNITVYYNKYIQDAGKYEDQLTSCLDILATLSQLCMLNGIDFPNTVLPKFHAKQDGVCYQIILPSVLQEGQGFMYFPDTNIFPHACTFLSTMVQFMDQDMIDHCMRLVSVNLSNDTLQTESRTGLNILFAQIILFSKVQLDQTLIEKANSYMLKTATILSQTQQIKVNDELLVSLFTLTSAFYNACRQAKIQPDIAGDTTQRIFDRSFLYVKTAVFEDVFDVDVIKLLLETFIGLIGCMRCARNVVARQEINMFIKRCIGIMTGIQDDQEAERILQGFMGDYNKALQGIDLI